MLVGRAPRALLVIATPLVDSCALLALLHKIVNRAAEILFLLLQEIDVVLLDLKAYFLLRHFVN